MAALSTAVNAADSGKRVLVVSLPGRGELAIDKLMCSYGWTAPFCSRPISEMICSYGKLQANSLWKMAIEGDRDFRIQLQRINQYGDMHTCLQCSAAYIASDANESRILAETVSSYAELGGDRLKVTSASSDFGAEDGAGLSVVESTSAWAFDYYSVYRAMLVRINQHDNIVCISGPSFEWGVGWDRVTVFVGAREYSARVMVLGTESLMDYLPLNRLTPLYTYTVRTLPVSSQGSCAGRIVIANYGREVYFGANSGCIVFRYATREPYCEAVEDEMYRLLMRRFPGARNLHCREWKQKELCMFEELADLGTGLPIAGRLMNEGRVVYLGCFGELNQGQRWGLGVELAKSLVDSSYELPGCLLPGRVLL